jgi:hypothetical protein
MRMRMRTGHGWCNTCQHKIFRRCLIRSSVYEKIQNPVSPCDHCLHVGRTEFSDIGNQTCYWRWDGEIHAEYDTYLADGIIAECTKE